MVTPGSFCPCNEGAWASIVGERGTKELRVRARSKITPIPNSVIIDCLDIIFFVSASISKSVSGLFSSAAPPGRFNVPERLNCESGQGP